jgi:hypothetical protein
MSEPNASAPVLGVSAEQIEIVDSRQLAELSLALTLQCTRYLDIVSRHLDPPVYDNDAFFAAVKQLALGNRYARIRLLITDSRPLVTHGHRLINLAMRLPSFIAVRSPAAQHREFNEAFLLADNVGYVHRRFADRFEGTANFCDRRLCAALGERFEELWERGTPDPNFKRLHL